jgi:hypothetical protein
MLLPAEVAPSPAMLGFAPIPAPVEGRPGYETFSPLVPMQTKPRLQARARAAVVKIM